MSARLFFFTVGYYLWCRCKDPHILMAKGGQLVDRLALHKHRHMRLSQMTEELNDILLGYIGTNIVMYTFDLCFVISTLPDDHIFTAIARAVTILFLWVSLFMSVVDIVQPNASSSFAAVKIHNFRYWYVYNFSFRRLDYILIYFI